MGLYYALLGVFIAGARKPFGVTSLSGHSPRVTWSLEEIHYGIQCHKSGGSAAGLGCCQQQLGGYIKDSSGCPRVRLLDYLFALAWVLCEGCHPAISWPAPNRRVRTCPDRGSHYITPVTVQSTQCLHQQAIGHTNITLTEGLSDAY